MSYFHLSVALCLGILFLNGALGCATSVTGATWDFTWGVDEEIPGVKTVEICSDLCNEDALCHGFTWKSNGIVGYCYKFKSLDGIHACDDCFSGTMPENLSGACAGSVEDILDQSTTETAEDCAQFCHETMNCNAYTWYNSSTPFSKSCFLYEGCEEQLPCYGCSTGRINCIQAPQCFQYQILDEESRNNKYLFVDGCADGYCDRGNSVYTSPKWKGEGYYRFLEPAGQRLPEISPPGLDYCGTCLGGYLHGQHPTQMFKEVDMEACFDYNEEVCYRKINITVTNCNGYFIYRLVETPSCNERFCAVRG